MRPNFIIQPAFAWFDLALVSLSAAVLWGWPQAGWWPLLLALLPWLLRLLAGGWPWQPTPLDGLLLLFLLTAVLAAYLAPNPTLAWSKFRLLAVGSLLYLALAGQPAPHRWPLAGLVAILGAGGAIYFLLRGGLAATAVAPPKLAADLAALCLPFVVAVGLRARRQARWGELGITAVAGGLILLALLRSGSRGAVGASGAALAVWGLWWLSRKLAQAWGWSPQRLYGGLLLVGGGVGLGVVTAVLGGPANLINTIGGPVGLSSRYDLWLATAHLLADFRFSGSGLASFPALYAHYILVIPFYFLGHAHNLLADVALEQGVGAAVLLLGLFGLSGWMLRAPGSAATDSGLHWAAAAALLVALLHGLVDDPLYGGPGTPLLFVVPGLALAVAGPYWQGRAGQWRRRWLPGVGAALLATTAVWLLLSQPVAATWAANRGALAMARVELADWPTGTWADGRDLPLLEPAAAQLAQAAQADPTNVTAQYRLGLLAMLAREYETAVIHLEAAHQAAPHHRGVTKNLGYSYVWLGDFTRAATLLSDIPETGAEMAAYAAWWQHQGRPDLAAQAAVMADLAQGNR